MLNRRYLKEKVEALKSKGVSFGQEYVQSDLERNFGGLMSALSETTVAELVANHVNEPAGITMHPSYVPPTDVDLEICDQGAVFSVQVKTFEMISSKHGKRMSSAAKDWDVTIPTDQNAYVARRYVGADLISEDVKPVAGVNRLAHVGAFHFEPSASDLEQMKMKVFDTLREAQGQLRHARGIRVLVYDVRFSYIDSETLSSAVNDLMRSGSSDVHIEAVAILTYDFEREPKSKLERVLAPIWISSGYERAVAVFRPPHPIHLSHAHAFEMLLHFHHEAGRQSLFAVEKDIIKIDDIPYGPLTGQD